MPINRLIDPSIEILCLIEMAFMPSTWQYSLFEANVCLFAAHFLRFVACRIFKMFHIFIAMISFLLSFRNVLSLLPFSIFIMSIPLRLLMSFDICTYYCGGHKYVATLCLDVNTISPIHILHYK